MSPAYSSTPFWPGEWLALRAVMENIPLMDVAVDIEPAIVMNAYDRLSREGFLLTLLPDGSWAPTERALRMYRYAQQRRREFLITLLTRRAANSPIYVGSDPSYVVTALNEALPWLVREKALTQTLYKITASGQQLLLKLRAESMADRIKGHMI